MLATSARTTCTSISIVIVIKRSMLAREALVHYTCVHTTVMRDSETLKKSPDPDHVDLKEHG
jgi:hypothetical protein